MSVLCYRRERGPRYGFQISWHFCLIWFELAVNHYGLMSSAVVVLWVLCLPNSNEISWKSWLTITVWWELHGMHCNSILPAWCLAQSWFLFWFHCVKLSLFDCLISLKNILRVCYIQSKSISCMFTSLVMFYFLRIWLILLDSLRDIRPDIIGFWPFWEGWKQQGLGMNVWLICQHTSCWYRMVLNLVTDGSDRFMRTM